MAQWPPLHAGRGLAAWVGAFAKSVLGYCSEPGDGTQCLVPRAGEFLFNHDQVPHFKWKRAQQ